MGRSLNAVLLVFLLSLEYNKLSKALRKSNYHKFEEKIFAEIILNNAQPTSKIKLKYHLGEEKGL